MTFPVQHYLLLWCKVVMSSPPSAMKNWLKKIWFIH